MILCLCEGLSETVVRDVISQGAASVREVAQRCGAGADCRYCCKAIRTMIRRRVTTKRD